LTCQSSKQVDSIRRLEPGENVPNSLTQTEEERNLKAMTLREEIQKRIVNMDDAVLPDVLREPDFLEQRRNCEFPQDFLDMMQTPKNNGLAGEEALKIATEAVNADRQKSFRETAF
jgi:hypothetical protein